MLLPVPAEAQAWVAVLTAATEKHLLYIFTLILWYLGIYLIKCQTLNN